MPTAFFHHVLGDTYGYTEGYWTPETRTLDEAQHNNFDMICRKLDLHPGDRLVEIGPGWGYLSMLAAEKYGADVTSYGLVTTQNDAMRELMLARLPRQGEPRRKRPPRARRRTLPLRPLRVDGRARARRTGLQRAVDPQHCTGLRPGGIGLISATFNIRKRPTNYCTIKHIFPGGYIPSLAETLLLMEKHGLDVREVENRSYHYHRSVACWLEHFETRWERIRAIDPARFDEKFRRAWRFYLAGAVETFAAAREIINCYHITFVKGRFAQFPPPAPRRGTGEPSAQEDIQPTLAEATAGA